MPISPGEPLVTPVPQIAQRRLSAPLSISQQVVFPPLGVAELAQVAPRSVLRLGVPPKTMWYMSHAPAPTGMPKERIFQESAGGAASGSTQAGPSASSR